MARAFNVNVNRFDPYKNYQFIIKLETSSTPVAGVSKISGMKRTTDVIEYKEGGNPVTMKGIGRTKYEPITLERGVTHDPDFESWANTVQVLDKGFPTAGPGPVRREVTIELQNEQGVPVQRYIVHRCWVSEYQALPDLDAGGNAVALEHIKLEHEGWERDPTLVEPAQSPT